MNEQTLQKAEDLHYKFQIGCYFSDSKKINNGLLIWSNKIKDPYWNYATKVDIEGETVSDFLIEVETFLKSKNRIPTIYVTPFTKPKNIIELAKKHNFNFQPEYKDVWMFYKGNKPEIDMPNDFVIKKVETKQEMKIFVDIFNKAYSGEDPNDPYGALPPEYGESLFESFDNKDNNKITIHYLGYFNDKLIGINTLIYSGEYGCIYNLGTLPDNKKKGIGSTLTLFAVKEAMDKGVKIIFLQTEKGSYNEKFFNKLGFSSEFIGQGFVLKE